MAASPCITTPPPKLLQDTDVDNNTPTTTSTTNRRGGNELEDDGRGDELEMAVGGSIIVYTVIGYATNNLILLLKKIEVVTYLATKFTTFRCGSGNGCGRSQE